MPRLKQPIPLQKLAFDSLVVNTARYCDSLSIRCFLVEPNQSIVDIKQRIKDHMPSFLIAEFCRQFLEKFYSFGAKRPRSQTCPAAHQKAALEIMMDMENVGLTCEGHILRYLNSDDAHRIQELKTLDWTKIQYRERVPFGLEIFRLQDLTTFVFPKLCTDPHLEIIGLSCLKLEILRIQGSKEVTDRGLRALDPCSELRIIDLYCCTVSDEGVNELLSVHKKLEEFNGGNNHTPGDKSFDVLSRPISLVCPSVKRFALNSDHVTNAHLHSVVRIFPNLTYLEICCPLTGDLRILKELKSLRKLDFGYFSGGFSIENLKELLMIVGENISQLILCSGDCVTQNDLDFIFKVCANVEWLRFSYEPTRVMKKLVIPPFQKLNHLECIANVSDNGFHVELELRELLSLERLSVRNFDAIFPMIESMMFDNVKFPNLREVRTFYDLDEITEVFNLTAKKNNLDFAFLYSE